MTPQKVINAVFHMLARMVGYWRVMAACVVVLAGLYLISLYAMQTRLSKQCEVGNCPWHDTDFDDFAWEKPEDRDNAAVCYRYAGALVPAPDNDNPGAGTPLERYLQAINEACGVSRAQDAKDGDTVNPPVSVDDPAVQQFIERNPRIFEILREAQNKPACQFGQYGDSFSTSATIDLLAADLTSMRVLIRLAAGRALWEMHHGNVEEACAWLTTGLHTANDLRNDPILIVALVRNYSLGVVFDVMRVLIGKGLVLDGLPPAMLEELKLAENRNAASRFFEGERCFISKSREEGGAEGDWWREPLLTASNQFFVNDLLGGIIQAVREPDCVVRHEMLAGLCEKYGADAAVLPWNAYRIDAALLAPSFLNATVSMDTLFANAAAARIAFGLWQYQKTHGEFPDTLKDMVPDTLPGLPVDPFSGKPFLYRREGQGFLLYSVGKNGRDDGGKSTDRAMGDIVWCAER